MAQLPHAWLGRGVLVWHLVREGPWPFVVHVQACDVGCGMFERMTLDTPQMSLTALSHIFSQLQGGGNHRPHRATEGLHPGAE